MQYVLTQRGIIPAEDVLPGDFLYEYGTNKLIQIHAISRLDNQRIYDVRYTDGRVEKVGEDEKVFFNNKIYSPFELTGGILNNIIPIHRYVCDYDKLYEGLDPDPYVTGALFIYGDLNDEYINLPADRDEADAVLLHKYNITYANETHPTKKYYTYVGSDEKIKWIDFYKDYDFLNKTHVIGTPYIPDEYVYASPADRIQFITGAFDIGYSPNVTPDTVSLIHKDPYMIDMVQRILWSLGIMNHSSRVNNSDVYQLDILGAEEDYPGFFYDIGFRSRMINNIAEVYKCSPPLELRIKSVTPSLFSGKQNIYAFYTDKPDALYYSAQYLPRVAL